MNPDPTIASFFQQDHEEIDGLFRDALARGRDGEIAGARSAFDEYDRRLERHIRWEEELLFPAFENATGAHGGGPTEVMRAEHREIRRLKPILRERIAGLRGPAGPREAVWRVSSELEAILKDHNRKEEAILYPLCDRELPREARVRILARVMADKVPVAER